MKLIGLILATSLKITQALSEAEYPTYVLDFDLDASIRYNHIFEDLKVPLLDMENYWYSTLDQESKDIIIDNFDQFAIAQPDVYKAMTSLANILGLDPTQTVLVNLITEFSTYCTSIVARTTSNQIVHTRNLDFMHTEVMKQLVYKAVFVKDNQVVAHAPLIAGFMGAYTGQKPGVFSISYNSRHSQATLDIETIRANLWRTLDPSYIPT